jgi:serine/threonine-protein kinase
VADEFIDGIAGPEESQDETEGEQEEQKRTSWLPWLVLVIAIIILLWLFWQYRGSGAQSGDDAPAQLTAARVPDVVGMAEEAARDTIARAGFIAEEDSTFKSDQAAGGVVSQMPKPGTKLGPGGIVVITVAVDVGEASGDPEGLATDDEAVPNVVGLTTLRAEDVLASRGYRMSVSEGYSDSRPLGIIFAQSPTAGTDAGGGTVNVEVSLGQAPPGKTQVPNLIGVATGKAVKRIEDAGLESSSMLQYRPEYSGVVFEQNPAAGTLVYKGSKVFILSGE